jgi:3-hydroxyisobutyrate dehydrogenase-like beta-hydroxyacid dehydrogenase
MTKDTILVGFVGLGTMGAKMAANLQTAGYKLVVHDIHRQAARPHLNAGAIWADSPRALAVQVDVIFSRCPSRTTWRRSRSDPSLAAAKARRHGSEGTGPQTPSE